ncbi:MAG TPA: hypothetical protein VNC82_13675, partial [Candidatus Limnocylindria bacterium]|nr:hypothetical protein [Candidatus Limnocylindria bacterium]
MEAALACAFGGPARKASRLHRRGDLRTRPALLAQDSGAELHARLCLARTAVGAARPILHPGPVVR